MHDPNGYLVDGVMQPNSKKPERIARLLAGVAMGDHGLRTTEDQGLGPIAAKHTPVFLKILSTIHALWSRCPDAALEVFPNIHPDRRTASYP